MKVHHLRVDDYRVLRGLELRFSAAVPNGGGGAGAADPGHSLDLLVGANGTGKSTVLRALVDVFRQMEVGTHDDDFAFSITYERVAGELVTVTNMDEGGQRLASGFRVRRGDQAFLETESVQELRPPRYVTYTTGNDEGWLRGGGRPEDGGDEQWESRTSGTYWRSERPGAPPAPPMEEPAFGNSHVHVRPGDLSLVTLCGLLDHAARHPGPGPDSALQRVMADELGISRMSAFSLRFTLEPGAGTREDHERIAALQHIATRVRVQGTSRLLVFDTGTDPARWAEDLREASGTESPLGLFQVLSGYTRPMGEYRPLLRQVELFLEKTGLDPDDPPELHTYGWFSDGERTFLARMCMLSLFGAGNALILLDEPEVHFNDYWKRKLLRLLDQSLRGHHSHAILTTHSSIVLTDARPGQIIVLRRDEDGFTRTPQHGPVRTFAADPSDVLVTVFGAEQATGAKSSEEIQRLLQAYGTAPPPQRPLLRSQLEALSADLAPGFWRYRIADVLKNG